MPPGPKIIDIFQKNWNDLALSMNFLRWSRSFLFCLALTPALALGGNDYPTALALDHWENVVVTGQSQGLGTGAFDFGTVKYDGSGNRLWTRRYDGPLSASDQAYAVATDGTGNVYVTGSSTGVGTGLDYATIKMDSAGNVKWIRRFNGFGNGDDIARSIAVDSVGNVYVTGSSFSPAGRLDFLTIKYNSSGNEMWTARCSGAVGDDIGRVVAVDGNGNVYVTGSSLSSQGLDYLTAKYDSNGTLRWTMRYDGPASGNDVPVAMVLDASANVYVTGSSLGAGSGNDYATIKYDYNGNRKWVARFNGPANYNDEAWAVAVDGYGNVFVTGGSYGIGGSVSDYLTIKYDSGGRIVWTARYDGPVSGEDIGTALTIDNTGNVFVTGSSLGFNSGRDFATIKYNSSGMRQWVSRFNGFGNAEDKAVAIAVGPMSGNVYVTGSSFGLAGNPDYVTMKYNPSGMQQWVRSFDGP